MKYFKITQNTDSKIIGNYPQVKDLKINFHEARASQWGKIDEWKSDDDIPDLNNFLLQPKSKLTDLISNSFVIVSDGLFISEKGKRVFENFKVNGNLYNATIYELEKKIPYDFLWYEYGAKSKIDCKASVFVEYESNKEHYGETLSIADFEDYKVKFRKLYTEKEGWDIVPKTLKFNEYFDITPAFGIGLICNENVKNAIEENHLTGFLFEPLDIEIVFKK